MCFSSQVPGSSHLIAATFRALGGLRGKAVFMNDNASLTGVKVMVIDDSKTIRRSAEIFLR